MGTTVTGLKTATTEEQRNDIMAGASDAELREAFKLFDIDGDGVITIDERKSLISKVGGDMSEADAAALIHAADKDGNMGIDFSEFAKLWEALHGEGEAEIRKEFTKLDTDSSGFITKDEMIAVISDCDHFTGDVDEAKKCVAELDVDQDGRVS